MTTKELFKILTIVNGVTSHSWNIVRVLIDHIAAGVGSIKEATWADKYKSEQNYTLNLAKVDTWSTYDNSCIDLCFTIKNDCLLCLAKIYEGDDFDGHKKGLRFTAVIIFPAFVIQCIHNLIEIEFENFLDDKHDEYLRIQKQNWIDNLKTELLNN